LFVDAENAFRKLADDLMYKKKKVLHKTKKLYSRQLKLNTKTKTKRTSLCLEAVTVGFGAARAKITDQRMSKSCLQLAFPKSLNLAWKEREWGSVGAQ
jgi:hypothetical protein